MIQRSRRAFLGTTAGLLALPVLAHAGPITLLGVSVGGNSAGAPSWVPNPTNPPDTAVNWTINQAWTKTGGLTTPTALGITTSRASVKQVVDSTGAWTQVASNVTAQSDLGRSTEEARTNAIRNNTMQGAVAGTPGTLPTNWSDGSSLGGELTRTIVGTGTQNGIDYIDIRWAGTVTAQRIVYDYFDTTPVAANGQTWSLSTFVALIAGSLSGFNAAYIGFDAYNGGSYVASPLGVNLFTANSTLQRFSGSATLGQTGSINSCFPLFSFQTPASGAVDFTIRIGWPQLENNSLINSTVASATKVADGTGGVNGTGVYSIAGTGTAATLNCTWAAGVLTVNSVASAGSYTVFPVAGAALTYVSGTATGWTGATVNSVPTNLATSAFSTSPIKTTSAAVTRAADVTTLTAQTFGSSYSIFEQATPQMPVTFGISQVLLSVNDNSTNNRAQIGRISATGNVNAAVFSGGVSQYNQNGAVWAISTSGKAALATVSGTQRATFNGTLLTGGTGATMPISPTQLNFGSTPGGTLFANGLGAIDAIWLTSALSSAELQAITT